MLRCSDDSLYTGMTNDVKRRMIEHVNATAKAAKYTLHHRPVLLEALWECENRSLASKLEYRIKQLTKVKKEKLIKNNDIFLEVLKNITAENYHRVVIENPILNDLIK